MRAPDMESARSAVCDRVAPGDGVRTGRRAGGVRHRRPHQLRPHRRRAGGRGIPALLGRPDSRPDVAAHRVRAVARYPDGNQRSGDPPGTVDSHPGVAAAVPGAGRVLAVRPRRRRVVFAAVRDAGRRRDRPVGDRSRVRLARGLRRGAQDGQRMPVCTATTAIPSWTSAATMTTMTTMTIGGPPSSAASSRPTAVRCGRRA